ncbi:MAG: class I SAM-dependent methyltransferase [Chloroflexi bacterium]|nr:class I SAM-dependent methyltransferase [Chloroflexota bacterium]
MPSCASCPLFQLESDAADCIHVNRPGGIGLTREGLRLIDLPEEARVLEVGCGTGATLNYLSEQNLRAVGLDLSMEMLQRDPASGLSRVQADNRSIPLESASQQAVLIECALSLSREVDETLREFNRVLPPGGKLVVSDIFVRQVTDPARLQVLSASRCLGGAMEESTIREKVAKAGFTLKQWQDETPLFKEWLVRIIFKMGSLDALYQSLFSCPDEAAPSLISLGTEIKLGYYLLVAEKNGSRSPVQTNRR